MPAGEITLELLSKFLARVLRDRFFGTIELCCENGRVYSVRNVRTFKREDMEALTAS